MKKAVTTFLLLTAFSYLSVAKQNKMTQDTEIWLPVVGYEGLYEVSNLGRVKSLARKIRNPQGFRFLPERILSPDKSTEYYRVQLHKNGNKMRISVHQLVAMSFLGHKPDGYKLVVNHIDINPHNNNLSNLEIVTHRENNNRKHIPHTSKYVGVFWDKEHLKWRARFSIHGKQKCLGRYKNEIDAHLAYENELKKHLNDTVNN